MNRNYVLGSVIFLITIAFDGAMIRPIKAVLAATEDNKIQPLVTTAELSVGENRFAFGLVQANRLVENAEVLVRLFLITDESAQLAAEVNASYKSVRPVTTKNTVHRHADGTQHVHASDAAVRGLYVTRLNFTQPGTWVLSYWSEKTASFSSRSAGR
jgi:hypothetical protein